MNYSELVNLYFDRSNALQWFWTIYVVVLGGVVAFSAFRERPETLITILVSVLYGCFAHKNMGAIEATAEERQAILVALREYPQTGANGEDIKRVRDHIEPKMPDYDVAGAKNFHRLCDVLLLGFLWAKEWHRHRKQQTEIAGAK